MTRPGEVARTYSLMTTFPNRVILFFYPLPFVIVNFNSFFLFLVCRGCLVCFFFCLDPSAFESRALLSLMVYVRMSYCCSFRSSKMRPKRLKQRALRVLQWSKSIIDCNYKPRRILKDKAKSEWPVFLS